TKNADIAATAKIDTTGDGGHSASQMALGFLDVNMSVQKFLLDGKIDLSLNGGATIPFSSFGSISTTATSSGTIDADVIVSVDNVSGTTFSDGFHSPPKEFKVEFHGTPLGPQVSAIANSGDPRTAPLVKLNASADTQLEPFKNVDPGAIVGLLKSFIDRLATLPASSVLSLPLP